MLFADMLRDAGERIAIDLPAETADHVRRRVLLAEALGQLKRDGSTAAARPRMISGAEYAEVLGLEEVEGWEGKFSQEIWNIAGAA